MERRYTGRVLRALQPALPVIALVLLAWTAIDLAYPQCCFRESAPMASPAMAAASETTPAQSDATVDDCFCCATCVDTGVRAPSFDAEAQPADFDEPLMQLWARPSSLDHPPQNA